MLDYTVWAYLVYLLISVIITVWVARTLHRNGRVFLVTAFGGDESLADSVNHLLLVGFYLINIGFVTLALREKFGQSPTDLQGTIEMLSTKVGIVVVVLGAMHFLNLFIFNRLRQKGTADEVRRQPPIMEAHEGWCVSPRHGSCSSRCPASPCGRGRGGPPGFRCVSWLWGLSQPAR